ncbi:MAG: transglutaminase family protein [Alphaproteobacteria bacterium]|nr:transglutaminase family protein [Alphaproteobacteria bacterium]
MKYRIRLVSTTRYDAAAPRGAHVLRVRPRDDARQRVSGFQLEVEPKSTGISESTDFFGNDTQSLVIEEWHEHFTFRATAEVERIDGVNFTGAQTAPWEQVRDGAWVSQRIDADSPAHFLHPSRIVRPTPEITAYAAQSYAPGRDAFDAARDLMQRIHDDFTYDVDATDVTTAPADAFAARRGVCQDYAHVMIAGLRGLGLPAAYVSGFLRTLPPPGKPRLEGADATHAWVSVWCGDAAGWIDFDPTNAILANESHIIIGMGRDYADVAPETGVIVTSGKQALDVAVDVTPLG